MMEERAVRGLLLPAIIAHTLLLALTPLSVLGQTAGGTGSQRLRVLVGKSLVVTSPETLKRVSVSNPSVANAVVVSETQVLIHGQTPGSVTLMIWNEAEQVRSFDLDVLFDLSSVQETLSRVLPEEEVQIRQSGNSLVLTGTVSSQAVADRAVALAKSLTENVVNLLTLRERHDSVLLRCRIAEVDRSAFAAAGINIFSAGGGNTIGGITTQQFGGGIGAGGGDIAVQPAQPNRFTGTTGTGAVAGVGLSDLLNIFIFRPDIDAGVTIRALQERSLLQILAEPNVLAMDGREASFLAGGEFPFPVVQGGTNFTAVTIQFREFGVRVTFTPEILDEDMIRLKVRPEVSSLDFTNALTVSGFVVPALSTRRAETEIELRDGQSFAIAGLIDNRFIEVAQKIPVLGDIPFFGKLFRSRSLDRSNQELVVIVTPETVKRGQQREIVEPKGPGEFLKSEAFDAEREGKRPAGQP